MQQFRTKDPIGVKFHGFHPDSRPGSVKIPAGQPSTSDQLDWGQYVVYSRKQVSCQSLAPGKMPSHLLPRFVTLLR